MSVLVRSNFLIKKNLISLSFVVLINGGAGAGRQAGGLLSAIYSVDIYLLENFQIGVTGMGPASYSLPSHYILSLSLSRSCCAIQYSHFWCCFPWRLTAVLKESKVDGCLKPTGENIFQLKVGRDTAGRGEVQFYSGSLMNVQDNGRHWHPGLRWETGSG